MKKDKTEVIPIIDNSKNKPESEAGQNPILFVCQGYNVMEYRLSGHQRLGRPVAGSPYPDIPIFDSFVSKEHGYFDTGKGTVCYTALETTNGVMFNSKYVEAGTGVFLEDGDELAIPTADGDKVSYVTLIVAKTDERIDMWRGFQRASADKLTGLHGRDAFLIWWEHNYMNKDYEKASLFIMDVDDFKLVNDSHGHNEGDRVLQIVADELKGTVRYERQVCRWGGDEFIGVLPGDDAQVKERLSDLQKRISEKTGAQKLPVTVSIGYTDVHITGDAMDVTGIVKNADTALYRVKKSAKGKIARITL